MPFPIEMAPAGMFEAFSAIAAASSVMQYEAREMMTREDEDIAWARYEAADEFSHAAYTGGQ